MIHPDLDTSLQAIGQIAGRIAYLKERRDAAAEQVMHRAGVLYRGGRLNEVDLIGIHDSLRAAGAPLREPWASAGLPHVNALRYLAESNGADTWWGEVPDGGQRGAASTARTPIGVRSRCSQRFCHHSTGRRVADALVPSR